MVLDGNEWLTPRSGRFNHWKDPVPIVQEAGWAPGIEDIAPTRIRSPDRPYTHYVTSCSVLFNKYHSGNHIKKNEMGRPCGTCEGGGRRGGYTVLVRKPEGEKPFRRHRRRWRIILKCILKIGRRWRSWFRHYATNRKVTGSTPDGVTGIFH